MDETSPQVDMTQEDVTKPSEATGVKRPAENDESAPPSKVAKTPNSFKNIFRQLTLLKPGLMFDLEKDECTDGINTTYTMVVDVDGVKFRGEGPSKRNAKVVAAELVLAHLEAMGVQPVPESERPPKDQTKTQSDAPPQPPPLTEEQKALQASGKNPVMMLHEIRPNFGCEVTSCESKGATRKVEMTITVENKKFTGYGRSNKLARARAAVNALETLFSLQFTDFGENEIPVYLGDEHNWRRFTKKAEKTFQAAQQPQGKQIKNAMMQLNDMYKGLEFKVTERSGPDHCPFFKVNVDVEGQTFEGQGSTKKAAKLNAAERALVELSLSGALAQRAAQKKQQKWGNQKPGWNNNNGAGKRQHGKGVPQLSQSFHPASQNDSGQMQWQMNSRPNRGRGGRGGGKNWGNQNTQNMDNGMMNTSGSFMRGGRGGMQRGRGRGQNNQMGGIAQGDMTYSSPLQGMGYSPQKPQGGMGNMIGPGPARGRGMAQNNMRGAARGALSGRGAAAPATAPARGRGAAMQPARGRGRGVVSQTNTAANNSFGNQASNWKMQDTSTYNVTEQWDSSNYGYDTSYDMSYDTTGGYDTTNSTYDNSASGYDASATGYGASSTGYNASYSASYDNEYEAAYQSNYSSGYQDDGTDWSAAEYYNY